MMELRLKYKGVLQVNPMKKILGLLALSLAASTANAAFIVDIYDNASWSSGSAELNHTTQARSYVNANTATSTYSKGSINFYDQGVSNINGFNTEFWPHATTASDNETFITHITGSFYLAVDSFLGSWSDDGIDFLVDGAAYISNPLPHAPEYDLSTMSVLAGWHTLDVVLYERTGAAALQLFAKAVSGGAISLLNSPTAVPIPAAAFLFAPALLGFMGLRRKAKTASI